MKKPNERPRRRELARIAAITDEAIDTSDIPELTEEQMRRAIRGRFYRPVKKLVTIRLDSDVIQWLKDQGPGYQTRANLLLREEMLRQSSRSRGRRRTNRSAGGRPNRSRMKTSETPGD